MQKSKVFCPLQNVISHIQTKNYGCPEYRIFEGHEILDFYIQQIRDFVFNSQLIFDLPVLFFYKLPSDNMIKVDKELCKGCNICTEFCPFKVYEQSKKPNKKGVRLPTPEHEDRCTKCGLCALMCPDQAIRVEDKEE
jgi:2-oxoglutarate ferredoxin oxidoreductase subunit delta